jgi:hypothetical protein
MVRRMTASCRKRAVVCKRRHALSSSQIELNRPRYDMVAVLSGKRTSGSTSVVVERRSPQMAFETSLFKGGFREPSRRGGLGPSGIHPSHLRASACAHRLRWNAPVLVNL